MHCRVLIKLRTAHFSVIPIVHLWIRNYHVNRYEYQNEAQRSNYKRTKKNFHYHLSDKFFQFCVLISTRNKFSFHRRTRKLTTHFVRLKMWNNIDNWSRMVCCTHFQTFYSLTHWNTLMTTLTASPIYSIFTSERIKLLISFCCIIMSVALQNFKKPGKQNQTSLLLGH